MYMLQLLNVKSVSCRSGRGHGRGLHHVGTHLPDLALCHQTHPSHHPHRALRMRGLQKGPEEGTQVSGRGTQVR